MSQKMIIFIGNVTIKVISENKLKRLSQFPIILSLNLIIGQFIEWAKDDYFSAKYRLYILFYSAYVRL